MPTPIPDTTQHPTGEQVNPPTITPDTGEYELVTVQMTICRPCLDGVGSECHTPGCALWMHRVDLPIRPEFYQVVVFDEARS
jgi:hypothetical protein